LLAHRRSRLVSSLLRITDDLENLDLDLEGGPNANELDVLVGEREGPAAECAESLPA
jgi:hypothetical protein